LTKEFIVDNKVSPYFITLVWLD